MASFKRVTPPACEPVALDDARAFVRVSGVADDATIVRLLSAARERVEAETGLALVTQSWRMAAEVTEGACKGAFRAFRLIRPPFLAFTEARIAKDDGTSAAIAMDDVRVDPDGNAVWLRLSADVLAGQRLWRPVEIVWQAGYGDADAVPEALKSAILLLLAEGYERQGASGAPLNATPAAVAALLAPFRRVRL